MLETGGSRGRQGCAARWVKDQEHRRQEAAEEQRGRSTLTTITNYLTTITNYLTTITNH